jgi:hypothetical protein
MKPNSTLVFTCLALTSFAAPQVFSNPPTKEMAAAQEQLNKKVIARRFSVEEYQTVEVYITDLHKRGVRPTANWRNEDDCEELSDIAEYRDCQYFKRYYAK